MCMMQKKKEIEKKAAETKAKVEEKKAEDLKPAVVCYDVDELEKAFTDYKKGGHEAPIIKRSGIVEKAGMGFKAIISKEIVDRDGEIVSIDGMDITEFNKNPVLLDAHRSHDSVVDSLLGIFIDVGKEVDGDGLKIIAGDIEFANSPRAQIAKDLVTGGFAKTLSAGFRVLDFDVNSRVITKSVLYEASLVSIPANIEAEIRKSKGVSGREVSSELIKMLDHYKQIKPLVKEYRKVFMSDELCDTLEYKKVGDELKDLSAIYELITAKLAKENPGEEQTARRLTGEALQEFIDSHSK